MFDAKADLASSKGIFCTPLELFQEGQSSKKKSLHLRRRAKAESTGLKRSSIRGRGMEFFESRPYVAQDEMRHIDWRVSARLNNLYTKIFIEEKNRPLYFVVDFRPHMFFGTKNCFKSVLGARIAARLAAAGIHGGDQVGGLIAVDGGITRSALSARPQHLSRFLWLLAKASEKNEAPSMKDFWPKLFSELNRVPRGCQIFLISDLLGLSEEERPLLIRVLKKADIFVLKIADPLEKNLPRIGTVGMSYQDHHIIFDSGNESMAQQFKARQEQQEQQQTSLLQGLGIPLLEFKTSDNLDQSLERLFLGKW